MWVLKQLGASNEYQQGMFSCANKYHVWPKYLVVHFSFFFFQKKVEKFVNKYLPNKDTL